MCRWGCLTTDTTYMCKWCGTRYCRECLRGDFYGQMKESNICRKCNQKRCQGKRVEYYPKPISEDDKKNTKKPSKNSPKTKSANVQKKNKGKGRKK
ncbi:DgyrCDS8073 [Dimorphilus gyrociliatus]|uniref:DgyrCDS8073 n=1 Tax=Dimorphilus gyrociliatus TaxID=2664684 RepID=A0A7I8VUT4_9ANNE|nr:DgyrCDS8073 [Dimorphilus gyrociliatus]